MSDEYVWLIELGSSPPMWFTGRPDDDFTVDAYDAVRFSRQQDAERAIYYFIEPRTARGCKAVQHGFFSA